MSTYFWTEGVSTKLEKKQSHTGHPRQRREAFLVDVQIQENPSDPPWRFSFIYGEPRVEDRKQMWELLQRIKDRVPDPWIVMGDFNEVMWQFEHFSNTRRGERQMEDFREVLEICDLHDIGFSGLPWTFDNRRGGSRNVKVRLDRAVASSLWSTHFPNAAIQHLVPPGPLPIAATCLQ
jgi:hypothetical protein